MKPRHAAALALVGWYLMTPTVIRPDKVTHTRVYDNWWAPISAWTINGSYDSAAECEKKKEKLHVTGAQQLQFAREHFQDDKDGEFLALGDANNRSVCIATDDPRLKEK